MSAGAIAIVCVAMLALAIPVSLGIVGEEKRKRRAWRPTGYSASTGRDWWALPLRPLMVRQSLTLAGDLSPVLLVEQKDPRIVASTRRLASRRKSVERVRRVERRRPRIVRGAA